MTAGWAGVAGAALLAASATAWGAAPAEMMPAFPASMDKGVVAQWLRDRAGMPMGVPLEVGPDSAVAILTDSTVGRGDGVHAVSFREEAIEIGFVTRNGGRSLSGAGDINCADRTIRLSNLTIYLGSGLRGDRITDFPSQTTFRQPAAGSVLDKVIQTVCYVPPPPPAVRQAYVSPPVPTRPQEPARSPFAPLPQSPIASAPQPQTGPLPARPSTFAIAELPPPVVVAAAPPAPEATPTPPLEPEPPALVPEPTPVPELPPAPPPPAPEPAVPAPEPVELARLSPEPAPPAPDLRPALPAPSAPPPRAASGPATVQIGAFGSSEQAFTALDGLAALVPDRLGGTAMTVTPAMVGGVQIFRALVSGFPSRDEAQDFCVALAAKGGSCLVRP